MAVHEIARASGNDSRIIFIFRAEARTKTDGEEACLQPARRHDPLQRLPGAVQYMAVFASAEGQEARAAAHQDVQQSGHRQGLPENGKFQCIKRTTSR